jgi:hypothetical protein
LIDIGYSSPLFGRFSKKQNREFAARAVAAREQVPGSKRALPGLRKLLSINPRRRDQRTDAGTAKPIGEETG